MAVVHILGTCTKIGTSEYGPWALIAERVANRKTGGHFDVRYLCSGNNDAPPIGSRVAVTGYLRVKGVEGKDGKAYADVSINSATYHVLEEFGPVVQQATTDATGDELGDEEIPFHHLPFGHTVGHLHHRTHGGGLL